MRSQLPHDQLSRQGVNEMSIQCPPDRFFRYWKLFVWACMSLFLLTPQSVAAQESPEGVVFINVDTAGLLVISIESWDTSRQVRAAMRIYEDKELVEGFLGEGFSVLDSSPMPEELAAQVDVDSGLVFDIIFEGDEGELYLLATQRDVIAVGSVGEGLSDRRFVRFLRDVVEDGYDVRTPRGYQRIEY